MVTLCFRSYAPTCNVDAPILPGVAVAAEKCRKVGVHKLLKLWEDRERRLRNMNGRGGEAVCVIADC